LKDSNPIFIADTCIGGLSVVRSLWGTGSAGETVFMADYAVNPLGVKSDFAIADVVDGWLKSAEAYSDTLVIACNTLSIRYHQLMQTRRTCTRLKQVVSMVDCFAAMVRTEAENLVDKKVLIIGTEFTASQQLYPDMLRAAVPGIHVSTMPATDLERKIARFQLTESEQDPLLTSGLRQAIGKADVAVLACTCFPMVRSWLEALFPGVVFLDPGAYCSGLLKQTSFANKNKLSIKVTAEVVSGLQVIEFAKTYLGTESIVSL
jgi:glutamate racemase